MKGYLSTYDLEELFPNDEAVLDAILYAVNGGTKHSCSNGREGELKKVKGRKCYQCGKCRKQIYPMKGTIMENTKHKKLKKRIDAMYELEICPKSVSTPQLAKRLDTTQCNTWHLLQKLREMMAYDYDDKLEGTIEVDEALVGGKYTGKKRRTHKRDNKTTLIGLIQREGEGEARIFRRKTRSKKVVSEIINNNIEKGSTIYTDDHSIYPKMLRKDYVHASVNHSIDEYVRGEVHTNSVENLWKIVKSNLAATHISMSKSRLRVYLYEVCFRYNRRNKPNAVFIDLLAKIVSTSSARISAITPKKMLLDIFSLDVKSPSQ